MSAELALMGRLSARVEELSSEVTALTDYIEKLTLAQAKLEARISALETIQTEEEE